MILLVVALAAVFGAGDQYLGSLSAHPWGADLSGLSAPWLVLPFAAGAVERTGARAAVAGFASTFAALCGYAVMTYSPVENAHFTVHGLVTFVQAGNFRWFAAGAVTGPFFAWLGYRWRTRRTALAALLMTALICLEPLVRAGYGNAIRSHQIAATEMAVGAAAAAVVLVHYAMGRREAL